MRQLRRTPLPRLSEKSRRLWFRALRVEKRGEIALFLPQYATQMFDRDATQHLFRQSLRNCLKNSQRAPQLWLWMVQSVQIGLLGLSEATCRALVMGPIRILRQSLYALR